MSALLSIPGVTVEKDHDDILVGWKGRTFWYEVKSDRAVSRRTGRVLDKEKRKSQRRLEDRWTGHYKVVSSLDEILKDMGLQK